ncbi:MAG: leucine-rich repeat protein, partial [Oscillospiraceae bacterium]|nr:leucine-rich repeat protein [Oscillospiraceae bacterium]
MRKITAILLVLAMLGSIIPTAAFATQTSERVSIEPISATYINPLYADVLTEADLGGLDMERPRYDESSTVSEVEYATTLEEAGAVLREAMKQRQAVCDVNIQIPNYTEELLNEYLYAIDAEAVKHTGVPTEGDYLMWQYGGWNGDAEGYLEGTTGYITYTYTLTYYTTAEQEAEMDTAVETLLSQLALEDTYDNEKLAGIYQYICSNVVYDYDNLEDDTYLLKYTAYAALCNGTAVCQGYAVLLYRLALSLGVDCRVVVGTGNGGPHAWNIAKLGPRYYNMDATWDAGAEFYSYYLKCEADFGDHTRDAEYDTEAFHTAYPMSATNYVRGDEYILEPEGEIVATGTCGEDMTWDLYENGVLQLGGSGEMDAWTSASEQSWAAYRDQIRYASIGEDIFSISAYAFADCVNMEGITIAETVSTIGAYAFSGSGLVMATIPAGVTELEDYLFSKCTSLREVTLSDGITTVGDRVFNGCTSLIGGFLPDSVTTMGTATFYGCTSMQMSNVPMGMKEVPSYTFYNCGAMTSVGLSDGLETIGSYAFYKCGALESVTIPQTVTTIGAYAFRNCTAMATVDLPKTTTSIGNYAFYGCGITDVYYGGNETDWAAISMGSNNDPLTDATIHYTYEIINSGFFNINYDDGVSSDELEYGWYLYESGELYIFGSGTMPDYTEGTSPWYADRALITKITVSGKTNLGDYAFYDCDSLTAVTIGPNITGLGKYVFGNCSSLADVTLAAGLDSYGTNTFNFCGALTQIQLPEGLKTIGDGMFSRCTYLTSVQIPDTVTTIGPRAFYYCHRLPSVELPNGLKVISDSAFGSCWSLDNVQIPVGVTSIGSGAFCDCRALTEIWIPDGVTVIEDSTFSACNQLTQVRIPAGVTSIGMYAFRYCGLTEIMLPTGLTQIQYCSFEGCSDLGSIVIPEGVTTIGDSAFRECSGLTSITLPSTLVSVDEAFYNCVSLSDVYYNGTATTWNQISFATYNTSYLTNATRHYASNKGTCGDSAYWVLHDNGVLSIYGTGTMTSAPWQSYASQVTQLVIDSGITSVYTGAFSGCVALDAVIIPDSVTDIGSSAFKGCTALKDVRLPAGLTQIADESFSGCSGLTGIELPSGVTAIGKEAFFQGGLTDIDLPAGLTTLGEGAFWCCESLAEIKIPDGVTYIPEMAFKACSSLVSVEFPADLQGIGGEAFFLCSRLQSIDIPEGTTEILTNAFGDCLAMRSVTLPESLELLEEWAFMRCSSLTEIIIPSKITELPWAVFSACTALSEVTLPEGLVTIGDYAFNACPNLESITLPSTVTSIGEEAFDDCADLTVLVLPKGLLSIGVNAFRNCGIKELTIPAAVGQIGDDAFAGSALETITFMGPAPTTIGNAPLADLAVTAYYPLSQLSWTGTVRSSFGSNVTWVPYGQLSGICGDLEWVLGSDGVLTFSGEGAMEDYADPSETMWHEYADQITAVVFGDGATTIGTNAFFCLTQLTTVTIPATVTVIGEGAFSGCDSLTDVYHGGYQEQWEQVTIGGDNDALTAATVHFAHTHSFSAVVTDPTCTEKGYTTYTCGECGHSYVDDYTDPVVHNYEGVVTDPTCTEEGYTTYTCVDCGDSYVGDYTDPVVHNYEGVVTAPTCTEEGYTTYTCVDCGDSYVGAYTDPVVHNYEGVVTAPTCTEEGYTTYTCVDCGDSYVGDYTDPVVHNYESVETAAGCMTDGYTTHTCTICGDSYRDSYVSATGHSWQEATCDDPMTCSACGKTNGSALGHSYQAVVTEVGCLTDGYTTYTCTTCGNSYRGDYVTATGHSWVDATCTQPMTCTACGKTNGDALGHSFSGGSCTVCGEVDPDYSTVVQPTLALSYGTVSFESEILYNIYFKASDLDSVVEMGMITFDEELTDGTIDDAVAVYSNYSTDGTLYMVATDGIAAKNMADQMWFKIYAKLSDGSYVYTSV